jgi:hypothetical protein
MAAEVYAERPWLPQRLRSSSPSLSAKRPPPVVAAGVVAPLARILTLFVEVPLLLFLVSSTLIGGEFSADISARFMLGVNQVITVIVLCAQFVVTISGFSVLIVLEHAMLVRGWDSGTE